MRRSWLVVALLLSLGINIGLVGTAIARRRAHERAMTHDPGLLVRPGERAAERLGLDPETRRRFVGAHRAMAEATISAREKIGRIRRDLRRELLARSPDRGRIDELLDELSGAESELNRAFVDGMLAARSTLDQRDLERFLRLIERFGPMPGSGAGAMQGARGGPGFGAPLRDRPGPRFPADRPRPPSEEPRPAAPAPEGERR